MIHFTCPCGKALHAKDEHAGLTPRCPACGRDIDIPGPATTSLLAIAGTILGILSLFLCSMLISLPQVFGPFGLGLATPLFLGSVFTGLPALILGVVARVVISRSEGRKKGKRLAITGIVAGTLTSLLMPVIVWLIVLHIAKLQDAECSMASMNNLKNLGDALQAYRAYDSSHGTFPPAAVCDFAGKPLLSWRAAIEPNPYQNERFKLDEPWDGPHNSKLLSKMPRVYEVYTSYRSPYTYFRVFVGNGAAFDWQEGHSLAEFTDGTSNTILVAEAATAVPWTKPDELAFDPAQPLPPLGGHFSGGFLVLLADGSVRMVRQDVSSATLKAAITRSAGDSLGPDW